MSIKANLSKGRGAKPWVCRKRVFTFSYDCQAAETYVNGKVRKGVFTFGREAPG